MEKGKIEEKIELVKSFYANDVDINLIAKSTNLDVSEVKEILDIE